VGSASMGTVRTAADFTRDLEALDAALVQDRDAGVRPIAVVATAGTTNTGAIDAFAAIAVVSRRHDVWLHVDAAYGGPAILSDEDGEGVRAAPPPARGALCPRHSRLAPPRA